MRRSDKRAETDRTAVGAASILTLITLLALTLAPGKASADPPITPPNAPPAFAGMPSPSAPPMANAAISVIQPAMTGLAPITFTCQWQSGGNGSESSNWTNISGGNTCGSFTIPSSLNGNWVKALVTATNAAGSASSETLTLRVGGQIVYNNWNGSYADPIMWVMNADTGNNHRLFSAGVAWGMAQPAFSPFGDEIAFNTTRDPAVANGVKADSSIWAIASDGTGTARIIADNAGNDENPQWSPDGSRLLYINRPTNAIWVVNADGTNNHQVYAFKNTMLNSYGNLESATWADVATIVFFDDHLSTDQTMVSQYAYYDANSGGVFKSRTVSPGTACSTSFVDWGFSYGGFGATVTCRQQMELYAVSGNGGTATPMTNNEPVVGSDGSNWGSVCTETYGTGPFYCRGFTRPRMLGPSVVIFENAACAGTSLRTVGAVSYPPTPSEIPARQIWSGGCNRAIAPAVAPDGSAIIFSNGIGQDPQLQKTPIASFTPSTMAGGGGHEDWGLAIEAPPVPLAQTCGVNDFASDGGGSEGASVHTGYGHYTRSELDLQMPGIDQAFRFGRSYCSADVSGSELGAGWHDNWETSLAVQGNNDVIATSPSGQQVYFKTLGSGAFKNAAGAQGVTLTKLASTYELELDAKCTFIYNLSGKLLSERTQNGKSITMSYDGNGRLNGITDTAGRTIVVTRDATNPAKIGSVKLPDNRQVSFTYDGSGRLWKVTDPRGKQTVYEYDANGKLWRVTNPRGFYDVRNTYDAATGRVTQQQDHLNKITTYAWTPASHKTVVTDPYGKARTDAYNSRMLLLSKTNEIGDREAYSYDKNFNMIGTTDGRSNKQTLTYDSRGNILTRTTAAPLSQTESWKYNADDQVSTHSDGMGNTTVRSYDGNGNLTKILYADGTSVNYTINATTKLVDSMTDQRGKTWSYGYDAQGNRTSVTSPLGNKTTYGYDVTGRQTSVTSPRGNVVGCGCAANYTTSSTFNDNDQKLTTTDPLGNVTTNTYDDNGNLWTVTNALNKTWTFTYDELDRKTKTTGPGSVDTLYTYDDVGRLTSKTTPLGDKTTYGYDDAGHGTSVVSPRGNVVGCACAATYTTSYAYDKSGNVTSITMPMGQQYTYTYDSANKRTSETDARNKTTSYNYDAAGNLSSKVDANNKTVSFYYDQMNRRVRVNDQRGQDSFTVYDDAGNTIEQRSTLGAKTTFTYDNDGRLLTSVAPRGNVTGCLCAAQYTTTIGYDEDGNQTSVSSPLGNNSVTFYDRNGRVSTQTNARNKTTTFGYDATNRLATVTDPLSKVTQYFYDDYDRLTKTTDPKLRDSTYVYNTGGELTSVTKPGPTARTWGFEYDPEGNRTKITDANGNATAGDATDGITNFSYDANGRPSGIDYSGTATPDVTFQYDANGNRSQVTDGEGTETYTYDNLNRLTDVSRGATTFSYVYDDASRMTSRTLPDNTTISYGYNNDNQLTSSSVGANTVNYGYDPDGHLATTTLPAANGYVETRGYDRDGRLSTLTNVKGASTLSSYTVTRDADGNPTQIDSLNNGSSWTEKYTYDTRDRITEVCYQAAACSGGSDPFIRWSYDEMGNRETESRPTGTTSYAYNSADELTQELGPSTGTGVYPSYAATVSSDSASAHWRFGETSGTAFASAIGSFPGTWTGSPTLGGTGALAGDSDKSVTLNGTSQYGAVADAAALDKSTTFSVELWVKRTKNAAAQGIIGKPLTATLANTNYQLTFTTANKLQFDVGNGTTSKSLVSTAVLDTNWHHVVASFNSGVMKIYVDGVFDSTITASFTAAAANASTLDVGRTGATNYFGGSLDEAAVYTGVLSATQIARHASKGLIAPNSNLYPAQVSADSASAHWRLGETSGTTYASAIGSFTGTWTGSPTLNATGALTGSGDSNGAVTLNGTSQYGNVADAAALDKTTTFSIEVWVKRTKNASLQAIAGKPLSTTTTQENYALWFDTANKIRFETSNGSNKSAALTSVTVFDTNYHHVVATFASGVMKIYVDGVFDSTMTASGFTSGTANTGQLQIGRSGTTNYFGGSIDELAIYTATLSAAQVASHYEKGVVTRPAGAPSYTYNYSYDTNGNQTAKDSRTFAFDLANRLTSTTQAAVTSNYFYDGDGKRLRSVTGANTTKFLYDGNVGGAAILALERDGSDALIRRYLYAQDVYGVSNGSSDFYYHYDGGDSVVDATNASGATQWAYSYEPFGTARTATNVSGTAPANPLRFSGEYNDPSSSTYHLGARDYDPATGRFVSVDPVSASLPAGASSAYSYVGNQPTVFADPTGMSAWSTVKDAYNRASYEGGMIIRWAPTFIYEMTLQPFVACYQGSRLDCAVAAVSLVPVVGKGLGIGTRLAAAGFRGRMAIAAERMATTSRRLATEERGTLNLSGSHGRGELSNVKRTQPSPFAAEQSKSARAALPSQEAEIDRAGFDQQTAWRDADALSQPHSPQTTANKAATHDVAAKGGIGPVLKGQEGVARAIREIEGEGGELLGRGEITISTPVGRTRIDLAQRTESGELRFAEVKNGQYAKLNPNQQRVFDYIREYGGTPVGRRASQAGFTPGEPIGPTAVDVRTYGP